MANLESIINEAQDRFNSIIKVVIEENTFDREMYVRFLNMQYHLTNGVQKHFFRIASSERTFKYKKFRKWLIEFGIEEEPHYLIAKKDLNSLGEDVGPKPLDIELWWLYFDSKIEKSPLYRIGATAVLENISGTSGELIDQMLAAGSSFITPKNTIFLSIHRHGPNIDHGNEVLDNIKNCKFPIQDTRDIEAGAQVASIMYTRALNWVVGK